MDATVESADLKQTTKVGAIQLSRDESGLVILARRGDKPHF